MFHLFFCQFSAGVFLLSLFLPLPKAIFWLSSTFFMLLWFFLLTAFKAWRPHLLRPILISLLWLIMAISAVIIKHNSLIHTAIQDESYPLHWIISWWTKNNWYILKTTTWEYFLRSSSESIPYSSQVVIDGQTSKTDYSQLFTLFPDKMWDRTFAEFDYDLRRWTKEIRGDVYHPNILLNWFSRWFFSFLQSTKWKIRTRSTEFFGHNTWALLSGMISGDISDMDKQQYQTYIQSSLVHLVAVSGGNLVIIWLCSSMLFFFLPLYLRSVVVCICVYVYCLMVGRDSSVLRAYCMFLIIFLSIVFWKVSSIWRSMAISRIFLLCINPFMLVYDLWFLLSYGALTWIVLIARTSDAFVSRLSKTTWIMLRYILPSIWASLGTFPILMLFVWSINLLGWMGNIIVVPLVSLIMFTWSLSLFLSKQLFFYPLIYTSTQKLLHLVASVADIFATYGVYISCNDQACRHILLWLMFVIYGLFWWFLFVVSERYRETK